MLGMKFVPDIMAKPASSLQLAGFRICLNGADYTKWFS